jgi:hypothetical protein
MQLALYHSADGEGLTLIADLSRRVTSCVMATGPRGAAELRATVQMRRLAEQMRLYAREGALQLMLCEGGHEVWRGRLEDVTVGDGQLQLAAYGPWRALSDLRYTTLWSTTSVAEWFVRTDDGGSGFNPDQFEIDTNNRLWMAAKKGDLHSNAVPAGLAYVVPHRSARLIKNVAFDYVFTDTEGNYVCRLDEWTAAYPPEGAWTFNATPWTLSATASGSVCIPFSADRTAAIFLLYRNIGVAAVNANETEQNSLKITNVRVTTQALAVDTTLTNAPGAGATSFTVASAANIVIGMTLYLGGTNPERVTVTNVSGTTISCSALANAKAIGNTCRAQRVLASEIVAHVAGQVNSLNGNTQLRAETTGIQATTTDLTDVVYEDVDAAEVVAGLALREDRRAHVSPGRRLRFETLEDPALRPATYYVHATSLEVARSLDAVANRRYALYQDSSGRTLRADKAAAAANSSASQRRWGIIREQSVELDTTSATLAGVLQAVALGDTAEPSPRIRVAFSRVTTPDGLPVALWRVRAGDTFVIRNLARTLAADIDQVAVIRLARAEYDAVAGTLAVEAETPPNTLDAVLARLESSIG